jgi:probable HAF family extracellular repeat protein
VQFDPVTGNEVVTPLPNGGYPYAIDNNRQVTGFFGAGTQAALWQVDALGNVLSVVTLAPLPNYPGSVGKCINALGQVAGQSYINSVLGSHSRATLWQNGATPTDLGSLANNSSSDALGISTVNGVLQVVGWDYSNRGLRAFLWKNGVMTDLNSLISASGVSLQQAVAINPQGQIVGVASVTVGKQNTEIHGYLLTPR